MVSSKAKTTGTNTRRIKRKPAPLSTLPKTDYIYAAQEIFSQCEWCSTPENPVYMGRGFRCPHYHGGTPCTGHPMNLIMKSATIFNDKVSDGGDNAPVP
jgi:hypothetical protein